MISSFFFYIRSSFSKFNEFHNPDFFQNFSASGLNNSCDYYDYDDFTRLRECICERVLLIASMNIHSIPCNLLNLETEYNNVLKMLDVFCVCESSLKNDL